MTTRELSEVSGVSVDTIVRTAREYYPSRFSQGKRVIFTKDEAIVIMGQLRKKGFVELPQNEEVLPQNTEVAKLGVMVANLCMAVSEQMKMISAQNDKLNTFIQTKAEKTALPAPKLAPRDELRMIVNKAVDQSKDYSGAYKKLYTEIYYRLHINVTERSKNAKTGALDILESEGLLESAVAIAREIFQ